MRTTMLWTPPKTPWGSCSKDISEIELEARQDRIATDDCGTVEAFRLLARAVNDGQILERIQQPAKPGAVGDVFLHLQFDLGKIVRGRTQLKDEVRAERSQFLL